MRIEYIVGGKLVLDLRVGSVGYYGASGYDSARGWALMQSAGLGGIDYVVGVRLVLDLQVN